MTSEKLYTSEEVAALFGLTENGLYQYRKRFNLGILKKIQSGRGCPKGNVFYTESDIAFMRSLKGKGKESKYTAGTIIGTWRILERIKKAEENRFAYLAECVKCGFKRELSSSAVSDIATGKLKNKCKECARLVKEQEAQWIKEMGKLHGRARCSGRTYENSPERLAEIKEKYKNGVTADILAEWLGGK
jgi:hypothetical protein